VGLSPQLDADARADGAAAAARARTALPRARGPARDGALRDLTDRRAGGELDAGRGDMLWCTFALLALLALPRRAWLAGCGWRWPSAPRAAAGWRSRWWPSTYGNAPTSAGSAGPKQLPWLVVPLLLVAGLRAAYVETWSLSTSGSCERSPSSCPACWRRCPRPSAMPSLRRILPARLGPRSFRPIGSRSVAGGSSRELSPRAAEATAPSVRTTHHRSGLPWRCRCCPRLFYGTSPPSLLG
jgi:hypothetical protein